MLLLPQSISGFRPLYDGPFRHTRGGGYPHGVFWISAKLVPAGFRRRACGNDVCKAFSDSLWVRKICLVKLQRSFCDLLQ
jgi:hypothetical protein